MSTKEERLEAAEALEGMARQCGNCAGRASVDTWVGCNACALYRLAAAMLRQAAAEGQGETTVTQMLRGLLAATPTEPTPPPAVCPECGGKDWWHK